MVQAAQDVHQGGLARARRAHQRHHLAVVDGERNAAKHRDFHFAQVIGLVDVFQPDQFHVVDSWRLHRSRRRPAALGRLRQERIARLVSVGRFLVRLLVRVLLADNYLIPSFTSLPLISVIVPSLAPTTTSQRPDETAPGQNPEAAALLRCRRFGRTATSAVGRRVDLRRLRFPPQGRVGHQQHVRPPVHLKLDVRRQVRQQLAARNCRSSRRRCT